ncbi:hypothetical protein [Tenacibaculum caenipelagi]|uniref:Uncharacterized protein n=1 Tax=Tenacibaculum caenipelagi TaxID=1325435 RepID=A0A4R6TE91_9FLAO|nr:hypothetical protein [Tenacibaculum caenipelagi]TDQ22773.1 hypothetical protein DFQ07_2791 [Tenacibaculum caenipelagi]
MKIKVTNEKKYAKVISVEFDSDLEVDEYGNVDGAIHIWDGEYTTSNFGKWSATKWEDEFGFKLIN